MRKEGGRTHTIFDHLLNGTELVGNLVLDESTELTTSNHVSHDAHGPNDSFE